MLRVCIIICIIISLVRIEDGKPQISSEAYWQQDYEDVSENSGSGEQSDEGSGSVEVEIPLPNEDTLTLGATIGNLFLGLSSELSLGTNVVSMEGEGGVDSDGSGYMTYTLGAQGSGERGGSYSKSGTLDISEASGVNIEKTNELVIGIQAEEEEGGENKCHGFAYFGPPGYNSALAKCRKKKGEEPGSEGEEVGAPGEQDGGGGGAPEFVPGGDFRRRRRRSLSRQRNKRKNHRGLVSALISSKAGLFMVNMVNQLCQLSLFALKHGIQDLDSLYTSYQTCTTVQCVFDLYMKDIK